MVVWGGWIEGAKVDIVQDEGVPVGPITIELTEAGICGIILIPENVRSYEN